MRLLIRLFLLGLLASIFTIIAGVVLWMQLNTPYRGFGEGPVFVEIERGSSTADMGALLERNGVVRYGWFLRAVRLLHPKAPLQAGEYRFTESATALQVFDRLRKGDVYLVSLSIPEGKNIWEIAEIINKSEMVNAKDFLEEAKKPGLIKDIAPQATSLEGYLFPSTYQFRRKATAREISERLTYEFRQQWKKLGVDSRMHEVITMASLIEKETSIAEERPLVSSVFWNRMREGMRLDCDPTVIYAALLEGKYRGTIYLSDLQRESPYNTYTRPGMPPGPIANPGMASIQAALNPATTKYVFFVAKGDGSGAHTFSKDLTGHQRAVRAYRDAIQAIPKAATNPPNR